MKRILSALGVVLVLFGSLFALRGVEAGGGGHYACGATSAPVAHATGGAVEVAVTDNCFGPVVARIVAGTEVRWVNKGGQVHNVADVTNPATMPKMVSAGATLTMKFDAPGAFMYYCSIHPGMMGAVFVGEASSDANPELVSPGTSPSVLPPPSAPLSAPDVATVQLAPSEGNGMTLLGTVFLALTVGVMAGGGSTLLVRRLDSRSN